MSATPAAGNTSVRIPFLTPKEIYMSKLRVKSNKVIFATALLALGAVSPAALAEETQCRGVIGAVTLDNVFVPDGAFCTMTATTIKGNIVVGTSATLSAVRVSVNGNIQAEGATRVSVGGNSSIGGSFQVVQGGAASLDRSRVNGGVLVDSNRGQIVITRNSVGASVQAFQNVGGVRIANNTLNGNLQCKENAPAPTGSGNRAALKEDQCANL